MPPSPFKLPCATLDESRLIMVQSYVDTDDKRTIAMALGMSTGYHALVIQSAYRNLATFIRTHGLNTYDNDPARIERITNFIRDGSDTCAARKPLHTLSPEEARVVNERLRKFRASPQQLVAAIKGEETQAKKASKSKTEKPVDAKATASRYV